MLVLFFFRELGMRIAFYAILIMEGKMAKTEYMYIDKDTRALLNGIKKNTCGNKKARYRNTSAGSKKEADYSRCDFSGRQDKEKTQILRFIEL